MTDDKEQAIQLDLHETMNRLAKGLAHLVYPYGFALLIFPFESTDGRMNYISNAERGTMIQAMREFIAKNETEFPEVSKQ